MARMRKHRRDGLPIVHSAFAKLQKTISEKDTRPMDCITDGTVSISTNIGSLEMIARENLPLMLNEVPMVRLKIVCLG